MAKVERIRKLDPAVCELTSANFNKLTLELAHIRALAQVVNGRADDNDGPTKTCLMLLDERCDIIERLLQEAWDKQEVSHV